MMLSETGIKCQTDALHKYVRSVHDGYSYIRIHMHSVEGREKHLSSKRHGFWHAKQLCTPMEVINSGYHSTHPNCPISLQHHISSRKIMA